MSNIDWFKFEDKTLDFPFYKKNPHISKKGWIAIFIVYLVASIFMVSSKIYFNILSCVLFVGVVLYFLNWDYSAIFQKPKLKDVALAIGLCVCYFVYAISISFVLGFFNIGGTNLIGSDPVTAVTFISLVFSLMGEEFFKFIPFIFFLRVFFKYSDNRKLSVILSMIVVMVVFAYVHSFTLDLFVFAFFVQGIGSIFEFFGYFKTKNILVPYITHLCTDVFVFALVMLGV